LQISQLVGVNVALANAPRSNIKGAELEIVALPARGLQLTFNGGYLDARFNSFANSETIPGLAGGPLLNLAGRQLSYVSPVTLNFDVAYKAPPIGGLVPSIDLQYSWHDRIYFNEFNDANNSQGPVGLVNLSAAIAPQRGPWRLYAFVHNLTDQTVISGTTIYAGILGAERAVSFSPPRNFGVGASFSF
jgi:iron complex outermembrane receptor protein